MKAGVVLGFVGGVAATFALWRAAPPDVDPAKLAVVQRQSELALLSNVEMFAVHGPATKPTELVADAVLQNGAMVHLFAENKLKRDVLMDITALGADGIARPLWRNWLYTKRETQLLAKYDLSGPRGAWTIVFRTWLPPNEPPRAQSTSTLDQLTNECVHCLVKAIPFRLE